MNATARQHKPYTDATGPSMKGAFVASLVFHAAVIVLSVVGLPYVVKDHPLIDNSIAVEIVDIAETAQTTTPPVKAPPKEEAPKTSPREVAPKQEEIPKPKAPTVKAAEPPKPVAPERPDDVAPPPEEQAEPEKIEPKPIVKDPPKPTRRPALTKPEPQPEEKPQEEEQEEFNSLLRNLMDNEPQAQAEDSAEGEGSQPAPVAPLGERMTMTELDALRFQLGQCWKLLAGARYAEDLIVEIRLDVNPDRTVRSAHIVDQIRYSQDSFFRAAADSAYRAVFQPACSPLKLPAGKYEQWKSMIIRFDPREML